MVDKKVVHLRQKLLAACAESGLPGWLVALVLDSTKSNFLQPMYDEKCLSKVGEADAEGPTGQCNEADTGGPEKSRGGRSE